MDLLKIGMEYAESSSKTKRIVSRAMLHIVKKKADRYEAFILKQKITLPEEVQNDAAMLEIIRKEIAVAQRQEY